MERCKINKQHSSPAETAGGYVHLGCVPAALLCPHLAAAIFKWLRWYTPMRDNDMQILAFVVQLLPAYIQ